MKKGMENLVDRQSRTIWFSGDPGPMVPPQKVVRHGSRKRKSKEVASHNEESDDEESEKDEEPVSAKVRKPNQRSQTVRDEMISDQPVDGKSKKKSKSSAPEPSRHSVAGINLPRAPSKKLIGKKKAGKSLVQTKVTIPTEPVLSREESKTPELKLGEDQAPTKAGRTRPRKNVVVNELSAEAAVEEVSEPTAHQEVQRETKKKSRKDKKKQPSLTADSASTGTGEEALNGLRRSARLSK